MRRTFIAISVFAAMALSVAAQQPSDWANFARYAEANKEVTSRPDVVFMGNSITELWNKRAPEFFTENNYLCRGISGQVSSQMLCRFRPDVIDLNPKAVVILCGTNDVALNNGYITNENVMNNIISMVQLAKANKIKPILCTVPPMDTCRWRLEIDPTPGIKDLNERITKYAKANKITLVDYNSALNDGHDAIKAGLSNDNCHPTREGYQVMIPLVQDAIAKTIKIKKKK